MRLQRFLQLVAMILAFIMIIIIVITVIIILLFVARCRHMPVVQLTACLLTTAPSPPILAKRLAIKNVSKMTYIVSRGT